MKLPTLSILFGVVIGVALMGGCKKDDDEYIYPQTMSDPQPETITYFTRDLSNGALWHEENSADNCGSGEPTATYAYYKIDSTIGLAIMQLIPTDSNCFPWVMLSSSIAASEVSNVDWSELDFEFTFSELTRNEQTKIWLDLEYKELDLHVDLARLSNQLPDPIDDGVFRVHSDTTGLVLELNGIPVNPTLDGTDRDVVSLGGSGSNPKIEVLLEATNTTEQSVFNFQFIRMTSFGIPEG